MKQYLTIALAAAIAFLGGCAKESDLPTATGEGTVRALNAIEASPDVAFLIEERLIGTARFKGVTTTASYDDLEYTFNFDTILAGDLTRTRVASQLLKVEADIDYTMVISGDLESPDVSVWESPRREWAEADTVFEATVSHLASTLGPIDIYITDPATPPALGTEFATIGPGEVSSAADLESGEYVITITPAGDDTTILFVSDTGTLLPQTELMLSIFDGTGNDLAPVIVRLFNFSSGGTGAIVDSRYPPKLRFLHSSLTFGDADIYIEDTLTTPLVTGHVFKDITAYFDVTAGTLPITYTAPGNTGAILLEFDDNISAGTRGDIFVAKDSAGTERRVLSFTDRRPVSTVARIGFLNASGFESVDFWLVTSGEPITEETLPLLSAIPQAIEPIFVPIAAGDYDIYITQTGETTPLAGPIPLVANLGDVIETIIYENVDPNIVDFAFLPPP